jgi:hypothetical protein
MARHFDTSRTNFHSYSKEEIESKRGTTHCDSECSGSLPFVFIYRISKDIGN